MQVLLTGANGFLGKILKQELKEHRLSSCDLSHADIVHNLAISAPQLSGDYDVVIHCAGKAHIVPKTQEEKQSFFDINFKGTQHLCEALTTLPNKPSCFVLISSVSVYGLDVGSAIDESTPLSGSTPYALSKLQAEEYVRSWALENGINYLILRLPLLVGPNPPGNLGKMIQGIKSGRFFHIKHGKARKSMIAARDLAKLIIENTDKSGTYNLTDGHHPSFKEIEEVIVQKTSAKPSKNLPLAIARFMGLFGDVLSFFPFNSLTLKKMTLDLTFDDSSARRDLGWSPTRAIDQLRQQNYEK